LHRACGERQRDTAVSATQPCCPVGDLRTNVGDVGNQTRERHQTRAPPGRLEERTSLRPSATRFRVFSISCSSFRVDAILPAKIHRIFALALPFDVPSAKHGRTTNQIDYLVRSRRACDTKISYSRGSSGTWEACFFLVCASLQARDNQIRVSADFGLLTWTCGYNRTVNGRALRDFARDRSRCHEQNPNKLFSFACARSSVRPPHLISR
jgi:hypothetical protein